MQAFYFIGNLTRDPELTETSTGISIARFNVAVNRNYTQDGERKTDFFECRAWRGLGENVAKYAHKGDKIAGRGNIEINTYEDRDGNKKTSVVVTAQEIEFLSFRRSEEGTQGHEEVKPSRGLQSFDDDADIPF